MLVELAVLQVCLGGYKAKALAADFADDRRLVSKAKGLWFKHKKLLFLVKSAKIRVISG